MTEDSVMPTVCKVWNDRAVSLNLPKKGKKRDSDQEAYIQGAVTAMVAMKVISVERANHIGFLCAVGRLDHYVQETAKCST